MNKKHKEDLEEQLTKFHEVGGAVKMYSCLLKGTTPKSNTRRQIFIDGDSCLVLSENTINKCTEAEKSRF